MYRARTCPTFSQTRSSLDKRTMDNGLILFLVVAIVALGLLVAGVFVLAGLGWALVAAGAGCLAAAGFIRKGLTGE